MATQVIWRGNDVDGFYTSHLVTGSGRHTQFGHYGKPTGRTFASRTIADCMVLENRIFREWVVADTMAIIRQRSEAVNRLIVEGKLAVVGGVYDVRTGEVMFFALDGNISESALAEPRRSKRPRLQRNSGAPAELPSSPTAAD